MWCEICAAPLRLHEDGICDACLDCHRDVLGYEPVIEALS